MSHLLTIYRELEAERIAVCLRIFQLLREGEPYRDEIEGHLRKLGGLREELLRTSHDESYQAPESVTWRRVGKGCEQIQGIYNAIKPLEAYLDEQRKGIP